MSPIVRRWLEASVGCAVVVVLCIAYVDRPVAEYSAAHFFGTPIAAFAASAFLPMQLLLGLTMLVMTGFGLLARTHERASSVLRLARDVAIAAAGALIAALLLKFAFGRSQVYPWYVVDHIYTFKPFHGGVAYSGFPSATMSITLAVIAVLWQQWPRARAAWAVIPVIPAGALILTNGHWLSDIIGGVFLGTLVGWCVVRWRSTQRTTTA